MRAWTVRQWGAAGVAAIGTALLMGMATAIIDNPVFVRMIPTPWWAYLVWITSAVLLGLIVGTYVTPRGQVKRSDSAQHRPTLGAVLLAWFAVGCPTCNMLVVLALGASGAVTWFQPLQPVLAVLSLVLLGLALRSRLRNAESCPVPNSSVSVLDSGGVRGTDGA
ncbi:hypothetical protein GIY23_12130 [Allosaccharopolyspora coralli]|uniref:Uncharacterized protein n=1 Tax=Allosaccharopolyspora coralli TaxID=2665642 RepID=A0A5Q3QG75_9PSEU|nr:hypothetical protein GIY23_12130 [Allosaccharopolyspora coralli]